MNTTKTGLRILMAIMIMAGGVVTGRAGGEVLAAEGTIYVDTDASGANNGTSWDDAFTILQPALEAAVSGDQIWVAAGIYTPTLEFTPGEPRTATFQMKNGVEIYGGFDPSVGDVDWEDRDWVSNQTVLSGEIGVAGNADNSYHVFYHPVGTSLDSSAILDGFRVVGGYANGSSNHNSGGGCITMAPRQH
jgi:hypothetical protein